MTAIVSALARRARHDGARPLVTYYDLASGARTELSGRTFANWVDKTYHLLVELRVAPGDVVALPVAVTDPGHWVTYVLAAGAWQAGAVVVPGDAPEAVVTAVGPGRVAGPGTVLSCSLHPLGFGSATPLPAGVIDFSIDVRSQPDAHSEQPVAESALAWRDGEASRRYAELAAVPGVAGRVLVRPTTPWGTLADGYLGPLLGGGSAVVVAGDDPDAVARIAAQERVG